MYSLLCASINIYRWPTGLLLLKVFNLIELQALLQLELILNLKGCKAFSRICTKCVHSNQKSNTRKPVELELGLHRIVLNFATTKTGSAG